MNASNQASYRAFTNIALIKYWGKRNEALFLPLTSSLSLTLDAFYTDTSVEFSSDFKEDIFILNNTPMSAKETEKISRFVDLFRQEAKTTLGVKVSSTNHVPTAAGLASSASAFAALASACNVALELNYDNKQLSMFARQGSGSATRSLFGGFVLWEKGEGDDSSSSFARPIDTAEWDIGMLFVIVNQNEKKISSRQGMAHTKATSPFYQSWPTEVAKDLEAIIPAIESHDLIKVGEIAEHNAMKMHATILASNPSFTYFEPETMIALNIVRNLREQGIPAYATMDAGPNVKVICRLSQIEAVKAAFENNFDSSSLIVAKAGPAPYAL